MAYPTFIQDSIADAVTQANTLLVGETPAAASGGLAIATGQSLSLAAHNATNQQAQGITTMQSATSVSIDTLYSLNQAPAGRGGATILNLRRLQKRMRDAELRQRTTKRPKR